MQNIQRVAVYCGSNMGNNPVYHEMAAQCGRAITEANLELVYGGGKVGLMGIIADTVLKLGGKVTGVIPQSLVNHEVSHAGLTRLHIVNSMHERKALMADISDAFIMLPGGPGSWEEFFEIMTWAKLAYHKKPCGILNINGFYDLIIQFLRHAVGEGFLHQAHLDMIQVEDSPGLLLQKMQQYKAPEVSAWIKTPETIS